MPKALSRRAAAVSIFLFLAAAAVQDASAQVVRLEARPTEISMRVGETASLQVVALDAQGNVVEAAIRTTGPRDAVRIRGGEVEALAAGSIEVVAVLSSPDRAGAPLTLRIPVTISWPAVASIDLRMPESGLYVGTVIPHTAVARHADGSRRPASPFRWTSSDDAVATVDAFGTLTGVAPGAVSVTVEKEGVRASTDYRVRAFPAGAELHIEGATEGTRSGDVVHFSAEVADGDANRMGDVVVEWSQSYRRLDGLPAPPAPGQIDDDGTFVGDVPGLFTVHASAGPLTARRSFEVVPRDAVQELEVTGVGLQNTMRTTDFWVFEGLDGRDYVITGSKRADGHAFVFDITNPASPVKTDSIQVDARAVNDVKVSPNARYATMTREGASNRRNGVVILDLADPAHPVIAAEVTERLTGGVHNAFPTESHVFALSAGDKYVVLDVSDLYNPTFVSEYDHPDSRVHDIWVHDGLAYTAEWGTGVVVTDVGNGGWGGTIENPTFVTSLPLTGSTHAVFPYVSESTGTFYLFVGDEDMNREGRAWAGYPRSMGSYADQYDPETGVGGIPLTTEGYIQVIDFSDPENPEMVARYEVSEYGTHNIWVQDDILYQAYYEGGVRMVDVSGELRGNLYTQGREIAVFKSATPIGYTPNATMVWSAMPFKDHVWFSDTNSGIWSVKVLPKGRPIS